MARRRDLPPELPPEEDPATRELPPDRRRTRQYPVAGAPYAEEAYAEEVYEEPLLPEEPPPWWRRNLWIWLLLLLLAVVAGLLLLWLLQRDDEGGADRAIVPAVVGMSEAQAVEEIDEAGLDPVPNRVDSSEPEGEVVSQTPGAGAQLAEGEPVVVNVSRGPPETTTVTTTETETVTTAPQPPPPPPPANVTMPDVVGQNQVDGGEVLEESGLVADSYPVPSPEPAGTVVSQNPAPGTQVRQGRTVRLNVSLGPDVRDASEIPDVTGDEASEARQRARVEGFTVRTVYRDAPSDEEVGEVLTQSPAAGRSAPLPQQQLAPLPATGAIG
jgi:beta-lactam-binding protein with PASTA domain